MFYANSQSPSLQDIRGRINRRTGPKVAKTQGTVRVDLCSKPPATPLSSSPSWQARTLPFLLLPLQPVFPRYLTSKGPSLQAQTEQLQRDQAAQLSCALERQIVNEDFPRYNQPTLAITDTFITQVSPHPTTLSSANCYSSPKLQRTISGLITPKNLPRLPPPPILQPPSKPHVGTLYSLGYFCRNCHRFHPRSGTTSARPQNVVLFSSRTA